jgi:putative phage-type endonuclease
MEQRSEEWFQARLGRVTASKIADVVASADKPESKRLAGWTNYMAQLITERLTGQPTEGFTNAAMQWGTDTEPQARAAYEFLTDNPVQEVGFVVHPEIDGSGASPDGLVGEDGLVEIKCPNTSTHLDTLITESVPKKYVSQMQWQMACTGRDWCDFASFDPRLPDEMHLFVKRVHRDPETIAQMEAAVRTFLAELDQKVAALRSKFNVKEAA